MRSTVGESENFFLIHEYFENYEKNLMNVFFSPILRTPNTLKEVQFKLQKCLAKIVVKDIYYKFRKKLRITSVTKGLKRAR